MEEQKGSETGINKSTPNLNEPTRQEKNSSVFGAPHPSMGNAAFKPLNEEIPYEQVPLPSRGVLYPEDSSLYNRETVDIRVMTAKEEDILTSRAYLKKGTVITELIKSCIVDKSIDVNELIAGDRNAIMVSVRITGYGPEYPAAIECSDCGHEYEHEFDLGRLAIKRLAIDPVKAGQNVFEFVLPVSKKKVYFKFLTGRDEQEIDIIQDKMKKLGMIQDTFVTTRLKYSIVQIDDNSNKSDIGRFVETMRAGDSKALRKYIDKNEPGMVMRQEASCPACGMEEEVAMPLGINFFWPD